MLVFKFIHFLVSASVWKLLSVSASWLGKERGEIWREREREGKRGKGNLQRKLRRKKERKKKHFLRCLQSHPVAPQRENHFKCSFSHFDSVTLRHPHPTSLTHTHTLTATHLHSQTNTHTPTHQHTNTPPHAHPSTLTRAHVHRFHFSLSFPVIFFEPTLAVFTDSTPSLLRATLAIHLTATKTLNWQNFLSD